MTLRSALRRFARPPARDHAPERERGLPTLRRADAHPDAPARRPIRASEDLGQPLPMMSAGAAGYTLPADLETPLAALDPDAIPASPREPVRPVPALASRPQIIDPGERFETFELTPVRRRRDMTENGESAASIGSLVDRLERNAGRRDIRPPASIEETLGMLRKLAMQ